MSYPKVTFLRFRWELKSYLEACALYTVASLLGLRFLFFLAQCVHQEQTSRPNHESRPRILWKKLSFGASNTCPCPSPPNMGIWDGKKSPRAPSFLHPTCCKSKSTITSSKAYLPGGAFKSSGTRLGFVDKGESLHSSSGSSINPSPIRKISA